MRRLGLAPLALLLCGCASIPGTEEGERCNSQQVCVEPLSCDAVLNVCLGAGQSKWAPVDTTVKLTLRAVWGITDDDYLAVGDSGTVIRYHVGDSQWNDDRAVPSSVKSSSLNAVWGQGSEIWIGGAGVILHWNGSGWQNEDVYDGGTVTTSFSVASIAGSPPALWAVGSKILRRNANRTWTTVTVPDLTFTPRAVGVFGSTKVIVGASSKFILVDPGSGVWSKVATGTTDAITLNAIWGSAADNIWAAGDGAMMHFDGNSWSNSKLQPNAVSMWGTPAGSFYLVGGGTWAGVYRCTSAGVCSKLDLGSGTSYYSFNGVWCNESGVKVMVVGDGGITYRRGE